VDARWAVGECVVSENTITIPTRLRRFRQYPKYKESGVEWLGEIPIHWEVRRLKNIAPLKDKKVPHSLSNLPYVALERIESRTGRLVARLQEYEPLIGANDGAEFLFEPGDVLFGKLRPYLAKVFRADFRGRCSTELIVLRCHNDITPSFLAYQLLGNYFICSVDAFAYGTKMPRANPEQIATVSIAIPSLDEQYAIATFLDRETKRLNALIAKKKRLIELLHEQRNALLARVVIGGFNPNAAIRATGSAFFPNLPESWLLKKLRRVVTRISRPVAVEADDIYREIGIRSWGKGIFHKDAVRGAQLEDKGIYYIKRGDLVLNIVFAWEGAVAVASENEEGMVASHRFPTFRHNQDEVDLDFLLMFLQSDHGRGLMALNSPGAAGRNPRFALNLC
jgi:restriction endonuclease S subunit